MPAKIWSSPTVSLGAMQAVVQQLQQLFPSSRPYVHPAVDTAVIVPGNGPLTLDTAAAGETAADTATAQKDVSCVSFTTPN